MDAAAFDLSLFALALAFIIAAVAGLVKGLVGFAMPMIMISGLSTIMPPPLALAALIVPTLVTNGMQALRQGPGAAVASVMRFRLFLIAGGVCLVLSAQLVAVLPLPVLLGAIGVPVVLFAVVQIAGWTLILARQTKRTEIAIGGFAGFLGGMSGIWGPPTVMDLTALNTEKTEQVRVQGVVYGIGAVALAFAHAVSGVFTFETAQLSAALVLPAILGMWIGGRLQDRIDQKAFRRATLLVLLVAGLNLIRRAVAA